MSESGEFAMFLAVGLTSIGILFGPIGAAIARRIGGRDADDQASGAAAYEELSARVAELESGSHRLAELEERVDFAERLLAQQREPERLEG